MDTLTHALSGALVACATARAPPAPGTLPLRKRLLAGFAAAAFPDIDFALRLVDTLTYLNWHQGPTHSLLLLPAWAWLLAHAFARLDRRRHPWQAYFGPAALGLGIHIAGDALTAYGLMLWAPISLERVSVPLAFVIDPWLSAQVAGGLAIALMRPAPRPAAALALAAVAGYVAMLGILRAQAADAAREHLPPAASVDALPQPLSPRHWKVVVIEDDAYRIAHLRIFARRTPVGWPLLSELRASYRAPDQAQWERRTRYGDAPQVAAVAREAWQAPGFAPFRRFAAYPAFDGITHEGEATCVWFVDLRFTLPGMTPSFRHGSCRAAPGAAWQLRRKRGAWWID